MPATPIQPSPTGFLGLTPSAELTGALPGGRGLLGLAIGLSAVLNVLLLSGSIFMLMVYDAVLPGHSLPSLVGLVVLLVIAYAFQAGLEHLRQRLATAVGQAAEAALSGRVFALVLHPRAGRDPAQSARDLDAVRGFFAGPAPMALLDLPWMALFLGVLFVFHWVLGLVCLAGAAILVVLTVLTDRMSAAGVEAATRTGAERGLFLEACRRNAEVIRALGMAGAATRGWQQLNQAHARASHAAQDRLGTVRTFSRTFRLLLQSLILATGAALVIGGEASGGVIIASSILSSRALAPIDSAIANWRGFIAARQAWNRLAERLAAMPPEPTRTQLPAPSQSLAAETLSARVPQGEAVLFHRVSFTLSAGQVLGVVGASGSGKSSLVRCLVGLIEPSEGAVRLDGAALDQWEADRLGACVGYLPQDIELFDGSIAQNIARFAADASSEDVIAAATQAGVHELIVHLPEGYDTLVGPSGRALSAGQRQRVALARALFRDPFLLVLDEPNSNLDVAGDAALNRAVAAARQRGAIVVIVAHRPSALAEVDTLLWLDAGAVQAYGAKRDILPRLLGEPAPAAVSAAPAASPAASAQPPAPPRRATGAA